MGQLAVVLLADRPELIPVVARWHWDAWGDEDPGGGSLESWTTGLRERSGRESVRISWVALLDDQPVGSVALVEHDMATRPELSPWLSGLFVVPEQRGQVIGTALVRHCDAEARRLGVTRLYLYTTTAELYTAEGWTPMRLEPYGRSTVTVMTKDLAVADRAGPIVMRPRVQLRRQAEGPLATRTRCSPAQPISPTCPTMLA